MFTKTNEIVLVKVPSVDTPMPDVAGNLNYRNLAAYSKYEEQVNAIVEKYPTIRKFRVQIKEWIFSNRVEFYVQPIY